ncbi:hypothetical protein AURDEDRAFT_166712 [Auricularia subglabra TFB-10046 SS5]|nr:hypothetical protein AURDEDRAFT_166712 [Auricularia subglabra TFB-10046 SS5]
MLRSIGEVETPAPGIECSSLAASAQITRSAGAAHTEQSNADKKHTGDPPAPAPHSQPERDEEPGLEVLSQLQEAMYCTESARARRHPSTLRRAFHNTSAQTGPMRSKLPVRSQRHPTQLLSLSRARTL